MPAKQAKDASAAVIDGELDALLIREVNSLLEEVSRRDNSVGAREGSILTRVVDGLSPEIWAQLAREHNLNGWLAISLKESGASAVSALRRRIEELIFERDHDTLTGLPNRRYFDSQFAIELERAKRTGSALSLVILDLDHFKKVNDKYGHLCGDKVLAALGAHLKQSLRSYDVPARVGGEEFAMILPNVPVWRAQTQAERILENFREQVFTCSGENFRVTFSAGVAGVGGDLCYIPAEDLFQQADSAMYAAKREGRNRVNMASAQERMPVPESMVRKDEKRFLYTNFCRKS